MSNADHSTRLLRFDWQVTALFAGLTALTHVLADSLDLAYAVFSSILFLAGIVLFALGFWNGVQRSRVELVTLSGLLAANRGNVVRSVRWSVWGAFGAQVVIAVVAASLRPFTQQAFALLAPLFGIGLAALWGSRHARFHLREDA